MSRSGSGSERSPEKAGMSSRSCENEAAARTSAAQRALTRRSSCAQERGPEIAGGRVRPRSYAGLRVRARGRGSVVSAHLGHRVGNNRRASRISVNEWFRGLVENERTVCDGRILPHEWLRTASRCAGLVRGIVRRTGNRAFPSKLPFYSSAYLALRIGYAAMARKRLADPPDGHRFERLANPYSSRQRP